jgi:hypothetical protein
MPDINGNAIYQQAILGYPKHQRSFAILYGLEQFLPGNVKLDLCSLVIKSVEPDILHKNIEAVDEWAGRDSPGRSACACARNMQLQE